MRLNNVNYSLRPNLVSPFTANLGEDKKTVCYKHLEQMDDETLKLRSLLKAQKDAEKSKKMKLIKAIPTVTTAVIGTNIALAQPGNLAARIATGLGFLALTKAVSKGMDLIADSCKKKEDKASNKETSSHKIIKGAKNSLLAIGTILTGVVAYKKTKGFEKAKGFIAKEMGQLASEINNSKVGKIFEERQNKFISKYPKTNIFLKSFTPVVTVATGIGTQVGLFESMSRDIKKNAIKNYEKSKFIQALAKEEFNSIEAKEV